MSKQYITNSYESIAELIFNRNNLISAI